MMLLDSISPVGELLLELESVLSTLVAALSTQFMGYSRSFGVLSMTFLHGMFTRSRVLLKKPLFVLIG